MLKVLKCAQKDPYVLSMAHIYPYRGDYIEPLQSIGAPRWSNMANMAILAILAIWDPRCSDGLIPPLKCNINGAIPEIWESFEHI